MSSPVDAAMPGQRGSAAGVAIDHQVISRMVDREDPTADRVRGSDLCSWLITISAVAMALLHMLQIQFYWLPAGQFKNLHVGLALVVVFLLLLDKRKPSRRLVRWGLAALAALSVLVTLYIHVEYGAFVGRRAFSPLFMDTTIAVLLLGLALVATGLQWDWWVPGLSILALLYGYFGFLMPGELFWHNGITLQRLISYTSIPYFQGLLGGMAELSSGTLFMFMVFAEVLKRAGGIDLIMRLASLAGARSRGGPAKVAVISSGLMGMISGSTVANVATTGAVTIPLMKRFGFHPDYAGAVESVASNGGQVTPPVMGVAAFLIVGLSGVPYGEVVAAAALPALIYYLYLLLAVHLRATKQALGGGRDMLAPSGAAVATPESGAPVSFARALLSSAHVIVGIAVLTYLLLIDMPSGYAALYATLLILGLDALKRLYPGRAALGAALRDTGRMLVECIESGAVAGAQVAVMVVCCGILVDIISITGFAHKLSFSMLELADGNLALLLVMEAVACLAFGLSLPTSASYVIVALLGAPALVQMGVPVIAAHMFVLYFANVSALTPPVALAVLVACNISGGSFARTSIIAMWLGLPSYLLPFVFVMHPELLLVDGTVPVIIAKFLLALSAIAAFNVVIEGYLLRRVTMIERGLLVVASLAILYPGWASATIGAVLMLGVLARQAWLARLPEPATA